MKKTTNKKSLTDLIESIVLEIINEAEEDIITQDPLVKIFVTPFTDIIATAKGELEKNVAIGYSTIKNIAKQAAVLAIPFFAGSMIDDIQKNSEAKLNQRLSQINQRYASVLKRNWDTVRGRDVWGITFMLDPSFGIAEKFILRAPYAALGILEILTGAHPKVTDLKEKARRLVHHVTPSYLSSTGASAGGGGYGGVGYGDFFGDFSDAGFGESFNPLKEQQVNPKAVKEKIITAITNLKSDPEIQKALATSAISKELQAGALEAIQNTIKPVMSASSYDQLKRVIGPEFDKWEQEYMKTVPEEAKTPENIKELQKALVPHIKNVYRTVLQKQLQKLSKEHPSISKSIETINQQINKI